jgi:hypothetical protein
MLRSGLTQKGCKWQMNLGLDLSLGKRFVRHTNFIVGNALLLESGHFILLENGGKLLLENA